MKSALYTPTAWRAAAFFAVSVVGMQVGTGGEHTESYYKQRGEKGYALARYETDMEGQRAIVNRTPAQNLAQIRTILKTSVTELADVFGVSRQAIYDWQAGKPMAAANAARLLDLAKAADVLSEQDLQGSFLLTRRKIAAGKTLFDIVRDGGSAEEAARSLIEMLRFEGQQREALDLRLAARKRRVVDNSSDIGIPMLGEGS